MIIDHNIYPANTYGLHHSSKLNLWTAETYGLCRSSKLKTYGANNLGEMMEACIVSVSLLHTPFSFYIMSFCSDL